MNDFPVFSFKTFSTLVKDSFNNYATNVLRIKDDVTLNLTQSWANFTQKGEFHHKHNHSNSFLSGVFYPGENYPDGCGDLSFKNPGHMVMNYDWDEKQKKFNQYNSLAMNIQPQPGMCLLFPSYVSHYVHVNRNKDIDRLAISFNIE